MTDDDDYQVRDITIGRLRYVKVRKLWGCDPDEEVLQIWRLDATYPYPTWEVPRHDTSLGHIWTLFEAAQGRLRVQLSQEPRPIMSDWVALLGLRHQGCLMSAVRGPDNEPKEGASKKLVRFYRACVLKAHVGDPRKASTFMIWIDNEEDFWTIAEPYLQSYDHFHNHFVMHFLHAAEICGYKMPKPQGEWWQKLYFRMVRKLHLQPESETQMDERLNRSEQDFKHQQDAPL